MQNGNLVWGNFFINFEEVLGPATELCLFKYQILILALFSRKYSHAWLVVYYTMFKLKSLLDMYKCICLHILLCHLRMALEYMAETHLQARTKHFHNKNSIPINTASNTLKSA